MKSIFRYPGGKSKPAIVRWILDHQPQHVAEYREPFVGGGGVFFGTPAKWDRWINDKHEGLIAVYKALQDDPEAFIKLCRGTEPAKEGERQTSPGPRGGKPMNARLAAVFDVVKLNEDCNQAFRYFFVNRTVHGSGRVNYDIPSRLYFSNPEGWDIVKTNALAKAAEWLTGVKVTCGDYEELFTAPGENVWIYADPPYFVNTDLTPSSQLYQHSFTREDHERFAKMVRKCPHNVAVSYDDCEEARELFKGMEFVTKEWAYCGTTNGEKEVGKELLILNYKPCNFPMIASPGVEIVEAGYDYDQLPAAVRLRVLAARDDIAEVQEDMEKRGLKGTIRIGQRLADVKKELPHGHFLPWLEAEFGWGQAQAYNIMRVGDKFTNFVSLPISLTAAYKLAAPSTPAEVLQEAVTRAEAGEKITNAKANELLAPHKREPKPASDEAFFNALCNHVASKLGERPHLRADFQAWFADAT